MAGCLQRIHGEVAIPADEDRIDLDLATGRNGFDADVLQGLGHAFRTEHHDPAITAPPEIIGRGAGRRHHRTIGQRKTDPAQGLGRILRCTQRAVGKQDEGNAAIVQQPGELDGARKRIEAVIALVAEHHGAVHVEDETARRAQALKDVHRDRLAIRFAQGLCHGVRHGAAPV